MKSRPNTKQIGVRLPLDILKEVDLSAEENERDRTREITHALRQHYQQKNENLKISKIIDELTKKIDALEGEVRELKEER